MRRRTFLSGAAGAVLGTRAIWAGQEAAAPVKRVLATFNCHLDVGFTDTQAKVVRLYFDRYYPEAMRTAETMRQAGQDRYVWSTASWLLYEYLEQANAEQRRRMEQAIAAGDIAWHALPFNWQTEMLDRSMIDGCLGFSQTLDRRFGRKTTGAKMSDVPGHSRGLTSPLAAAGVRFLDIGVNSASTPPEVPGVFVWKNPDGSSLVMMYHAHGYGSVVQIPGSDLAIAVEVKNDNGGPHTVKEIRSMYASLRRQFPQAEIRAASFSDVANAVDAFRGKLPVVTEEIGDTWIYGAPSDPWKVARYRETARLRKEWIGKKRFAVGDETDRKLLGRLSLAAEHTWGTDTKRYIDYKHYKPKDLAKVLNQPGYQVMERSWQEKRDDIEAGIRTLPDNLRQEAENRLRALTAARPSTAGLRDHAAGEEIEGAHFTVGLDGKTGAITTLRSKKTGREWASAGHPLALFTYQTLSEGDYEAYRAKYVLSNQWWAPRDFGKPNVGSFGAESREWHPKLAQCRVSEDKTRIVAELKIDDPASEQAGRVAWPRDLYLEIALPEDEAAVQVTFSCFGKEANRMPESMWLTFDPEVRTPKNWMLEKVDQPVSPFDVVRGGGRSMHAVTNQVRYRDDKGEFALTTLDAPVVAVGGRSPLNFSKELPDLKHGVHVNLFNNAWGTNYIQWAGGDWMFRFRVMAG